MPKVELISTLGESTSNQFNSKTIENLTQINTGDNGGKGSYKLKRVSGYEPFSSFLVGSSTSVLEMYTVSPNKYSEKERLFVFVRDEVDEYYLFEIFESAPPILRGGFTATTLPLSNEAQMSDNGEVLNVVTGNEESIFFNFNTSSSALITDADFPENVIDVTFKDTYFVWLDRSTNRFYVSDNNATDPTSCVNALDFGTVESNPDNVVAVEAIGNEVAIFGERTIEFYYNSGNVDFPFDRNNGATQEIGTKSTRSVAKIDDKVYFIGSTYDGDASVYFLNGYQYVKVSNDAIDNLLKYTDDQFTLRDISKARCYGLKEEGDYFYCICFENDNTPTICYSINTGLWSLRRDQASVSQVYCGSIKSYAFGYNIIARSDAYLGSSIVTLYSMKRGANTFLSVDESTGAYIEHNIECLLILPHISAENKNIQINYFEMDIQKGVGNVDDPDPEITLTISRDGGMTYGNPITMKMGTDGSYKQRVRADMLGCSRDTVFKIESDSPVQQEWFTAYIDYEVMSE